MVLSAPAIEIQFRDLSGIHVWVYLSSGWCITNLGEEKELTKETAI